MLQQYFLKRRADRILRLSLQKKKGMDETADMIADKLALVHGAVLEIGAGAGNVIAYLAKDIRYTALEPNSYLKENILEKAREVGIVGAAVVCAPAEEIPFPDNTFDFVISVRALCAPNDLSAALSEIKRVLKKGGTLLFAEHVAAPRNTLRYLVQVCARLFFPCDPARTIEQYLQRAGFEEVFIHCFNAVKSSYLIKPRIFGLAKK